MGKQKLRSFFSHGSQGGEGLANFFYKISESKYFRFLWLYYLCHNYSAVIVLEKTKDTKTNEGSCVPIKPYLWTLIFEFHIILSGHEIISFF